MEDTEKHVHVKHVRTFFLCCYPNVAAVQGGILESLTDEERNFQNSSIASARKCNYLGEAQECSEVKDKNSSQIVKLYAPVAFASKSSPDTDGFFSLFGNTTTFDFDRPI